MATTTAIRALAVLLITPTVTTDALRSPTSCDLGFHTFFGALKGAPFFVFKLKGHPGSLRKMIDVIRIHAYKSGILNLVHVDKKDAKRRRLELLQDGYTIAHSEIL